MARRKMVAWQPPGGGSRPVPIGSQSIGVSLQPAIPRRVAPQQSPLPLHQSPTIVAQSDPARQSNCAAQLPCGDAVQIALLVPCRRTRGCHLYFARRVTFLSCADTACRSPIETSPASPIEMSRSSVCLRLVGVAWDDGDYDELQGADAPAGADRYCRRTAIGCGRHGADWRWTKTGLPAARCVPRLRPGRPDLSEARRAEQPGSGCGVPRDRVGHRARALYRFWPDTGGREAVGTSWPGSRGRDVAAMDDRAPAFGFGGKTG